MVLGIAGVRCQHRQLLPVQQTGIRAGTPCASGSSHCPQPERMARECLFHSCMLPNKEAHSCMLRDLRLFVFETKAALPR